MMVMMNFHRVSIGVVTICFGANCGFESRYDFRNPHLELITTFNMRLSGGGQTHTASVLDPDEKGPAQGVRTDPMPLVEGTTYTIALEFLDEQDPMDVRDFTEDIREEAEEHLVVYQVTGDIGTVSITDKESDYENGNRVGRDLPVGLTADLLAGSSGATGTLLVSLRSLPWIRNTPQKDANSGINDGRTVYQAQFNVDLQ